MTHLTGVVYVQPTPANIAALARELASPKFKEYHIFFSNVVVANDMIQTIADADELGVVRQVQEFYADVIPIDRGLFSLNSQRLLNTTVGRPASAILSVFLSLKTRPCDVRFTASSPATRALGAEVAARLASDDIHDYPLGPDSPVLLILDRKSDPVTPLLSQWTYQAMVHELLGLNNGRVLLPDVPDGEVTLSGRDDAFFNANKYQNFGQCRCKSMRSKYGFNGVTMHSTLLSHARAVASADVALITRMRCLLDCFSSAMAHCPSCHRRPWRSDPRFDATVCEGPPRADQRQIDRRHALLYGQVPRLPLQVAQRVQARDHHLRAQQAR